MSSTAFYGELTVDRLFMPGLVIARYLALLAWWHSYQSIGKDNVVISELNNPDRLEDRNVSKCIPEVAAGGLDTSSGAQMDARHWVWQPPWKHRQLATPRLEED